MYRCLFVVLFTVACGPSKKEVKEANSSLYDDDFSNVFNACVKEVRKRYPHLVEDPVRGEVATSWHPVRGRGVTGANGQTVGGGAANQAPGAAAGQNGGGTLGQEAVRSVYFVRFRVVVRGKQPWQIDVVGQASKWLAGEVPQPLRGGDRPNWLDPLINDLHVRIHKRLYKVAKVGARLDKLQDNFVPTKSHLPSGIQALLKSVQSNLETDSDAAMESVSGDFLWGKLGKQEMVQELQKKDGELKNNVLETLAGFCSISSDSKTVTCVGPKGSASFVQKEYQWFWTSFVEKQR